MNKHPTFHVEKYSEQHRIKELIPRILKKLKKRAEVDKDEQYYVYTWRKDYEPSTEPIYVYYGNYENALLTAIIDDSIDFVLLIATVLEQYYTDPEKRVSITDVIDKMIKFMKNNETEIGALIPFKVKYIEPNYKDF